MKIKIIRETKFPACIGTMEIYGAYFGFTLERPWLDNKPRESAIPAGIYPVEFTWSDKFGRTMLQVLNVPKRAGIRIHSANHWKQLEGCLAVAKTRTGPETIRDTMVKTLESLCRESIADGEKITLEIVNAWPEVTV
jgi:hypothetical protein